MIRFNSYKLFILMASFLLCNSVSAKDVFVRADAATNGDGNTWETALNAEGLASAFKTFEAGTTFYLSEGEYLLTATLTASGKNFTLKGGYPTDAAGTETRLPNIHGQSIFKGNGNIARLLAISNTAEESPVVIENIDFTNAVFTNTEDGTLGALHSNGVLNLTVRNCNFYGNTSKGYGGIGARLANSKAKFIGCTFHDNTSNTRGAAIRVSKDANKQGITTLERCWLYDNKVEATSSVIGSTICVQSADALNIINSAVYGNKTTGTGSAIYVNGSTTSAQNKLTIISSTISGNSNIQIQQAGAINMMVANSIICCPDDKNTSANTAIFHNNTGTFISGGHNVIGSAYSNGTSVLTFKETDNQTQENNFANVFGTTEVSEETLKHPVIGTGMTIEELNTLANDEAWGTTADALGIDIYGAIRRGTLPGAFNPLTKDIKITDKRYATFYTDNSFVMPNDVKGAIIKADGMKQIAIDYIFNAGDIVPAKTALLLKGAEDTYKVNIIPGVEAAGETDGNLLRGTEEAALTTSELADPVYYKLSDGSNGLGWYWGQTNGTAFTNGANKAYLALGGSAANAPKFFIFDYETTGISSVTRPETDPSAWYTLQGIRIKKPTGKKGIYIHNNKRIIIR